MTLLAIPASIKVLPSPACRVSPLSFSYEPTLQLLVAASNMMVLQMERVRSAKDRLNEKETKSFASNEIANFGGYLLLAQCSAGYDGPECS